MTSTAPTDRFVRPALLLSLLGVLTVSCALMEPAREPVAAGAEVMYDVEVETLAELRDTSEAVVLAAPVDGPEEILLDHDGIVVLGQTMRVVRSVDGPLEAGQHIVVTRVRYGVSPRAEQQLNEQGLTASEPPDAAGVEPPFERPLYLLGLRYTGEDYPVRAWAPANGPHSRVALDAAEMGTAHAVVEVADTPLQQRLAGASARSILRRLERE